MLNDQDRLSRFGLTVIKEFLTSWGASLDSIAREVAPQLPASVDELVAVASANAALKGSVITERSLRKYAEKAIVHFLGSLYS